MKLPQQGPGVLERGIMQPAGEVRRIIRRLSQALGDVVPWPRDPIFSTDRVVFAEELGSFCFQNGHF